MFVEQRSLQAAAAEHSINYATLKKAGNRVTDLLFANKNSIIAKVKDAIESQ